jgi:hypothetical protein
MSLTSITIAFRDESDGFSRLPLVRPSANKVRVNDSKEHFFMTINQGNRKKQERKREAPLNISRKRCHRLQLGSIFVYLVDDI